MSELKLPDFFPATVIKCSKVSEEFFNCFTENSKKRSSQDVTSGQEALKTCLKQLKAYEDCMNTNMPKLVKHDKKFRVR
jgi:hypothetical protein